MYRPIGHEVVVSYLRTVVTKLVYQGGGVDSRLRMGLFLLKNDQIASGVYRPIGHEDGVSYLRTVVTKLVYQGGGVDSRLRMGFFLLRNDQIGSGSHPYAFIASTT
jgi:hypothetical protein